MTRDFRFFERWCAQMNMRPVGRFVEKHGDVLVADSGEPFIGENQNGIYGRWYRTAFCIERGDKTWLASYNDYPAVDFDLLSREQGRQRRVRECREHAAKTLNDTAAAGLYDHGRQSLNIRPH